MPLRLLNESLFTVKSYTCSCTPEYLEVLRTSILVMIIVAHLLLFGIMAGDGSGAELKGKALDLLLNLYSFPHLWS